MSSTRSNGALPALSSCSTRWSASLILCSRASLFIINQVWYGIDPTTSELQRFERIDTSPLFDVSIAATVTASEAGLLDADVFELTGYQSVWDRETPVVTTNPPPP